MFDHKLNNYMSNLYRDSQLQVGENLNDLI